MAAINERHRMSSHRTPALAGGARVNPTAASSGNPLRGLEGAHLKRTGVFYQLIYHFVWATKNREPFLGPAVEERLFPYLGAKCRDLDYDLYAVNGTLDHLHILLGLKPVMTVADVAKNLKGASSHYINNESGLKERLYWQDGYGVVTLRQSEIPQIARYIQKQKEHHRTGKLSELLERVTL